MRYLILREKTATELQKEVQEYLDMGWEPIGSPVYAPDLIYQWSQAIIER